MEYSLTTDRGGFLRIFDETSSITFRTDKDKARLLSVMVSSESRRRGAGRSIILAAEAELYNRGITTVTADFMKDIEGVPEFLKACGYELRDSRPVVSVDTDRLLEARAVKKAMRCSFDDGLYMPAYSLVSTQWNELVQLFGRLSIPIVKSEIGYFSEDLSGVVYKEAGKPKAFVFCSDVDDVLYVDFLGGISKREPQYVMLALKGLLSAIEIEENRKQYKRIAMLLSDDYVLQLLKRVLDKGTEIEEVSRTLHAVKQLSPPDPKKYEEIPEMLLTENIMKNLIWEYSDFPIQKNVSWKPAYSAVQRGGR